MSKIRIVKDGDVEALGQAFAPIVGSILAAAERNVRLQNDADAYDASLLTASERAGVACCTVALMRIY